MFFTCKQVSNHLSKEDYDKLPPLKKFSLKLHVILCPICGKYNRQVMKFQDMARIFRKKEEELLESADPQSPHLDEAARLRLEATLKRAQSAPPQQDL
ncbi:MAG: hypothetical protein WD708_00410 [Kiritimatiellia bacterium]